MKLGVLFPQLEIGADPIANKDYAQAAEALGYESTARAILKRRLEGSFQRVHGL